MASEFATSGLEPDRLCSSFTACSEDHSAGASAFQFWRSDTPSMPSTCPVRVRQTTVEQIAACHARLNACLS